MCGRASIRASCAAAHRALRSKRNSSTAKGRRGLKSCRRSACMVARDVLQVQCVFPVPEILPQEQLSVSVERAARDALRRAVEEAVSSGALLRRSCKQRCACAQGKHHFVLELLCSEH
eukprot:1182209-Pleurochrysis_carterae.AAC.5